MRARTCLSSHLHEITYFIIPFCQRISQFTQLIPELPPPCIIFIRINTFYRFHVNFRIVIPIILCEQSDRRLVRCRIRISHQHLAREFSLKTSFILTINIYRIIIYTKNCLHARSRFSEYIRDQPANTFQVVRTDTSFNHFRSVRFGLFPIFFLMRQTSHPSVNICQQRIHRSQAGILFGSNLFPIHISQLIISRKSQCQFCLFSRFFQYFQGRPLTLRGYRLRTFRYGSITPNLGKPEISHCFREMSLPQPELGPFLGYIFKTILILDNHVSHIYRLVKISPTHIQHHTFLGQISIRIQCPKSLISPLNIIGIQRIIKLRLIPHANILHVGSNTVMQSLKFLLIFEVIDKSHRIFRLDSQPIIT